MGERAEDFQEALQLTVFGSNIFLLQPRHSVPLGSLQCLCDRGRGCNGRRLKTCRNQRLRSIQLRKIKQGTAIEGQV